MSRHTPTKLFLLYSRLLKIALNNPSGLRPVLGHALAESENHLNRAHDTARLPHITLEELADENSGPLEILTELFSQLRHSILVIEAVALGVLLQKFKAKRVFEFGTNRGVSTTQLALNV